MLQGLQGGIGWDTRTHELTCAHTGHPSASWGSGLTPDTERAYSHSPSMAEMDEGKAQLLLLLLKSQDRPPP